MNEGRLGLGVVRLKKEEILAAIRKNRDDHRGIFLEAQEGFRKAVIAELDKMLKDAREGKGIKTFIQLEEPQDHTAAYARVIRMLEMSVDAEVELTQEEFAQYVLDDWGWKQHFLANTASYR